MGKIASQTQWEDLASRIKGAGVRVFRGNCSTAGDVGDKVFNVSGTVPTTGDDFQEGDILRVDFSYANTASNVRFIINGGSAKILRNQPYWSGSLWMGNSSAVFVYMTGIYAGWYALSNISAGNSIWGLVKVVDAPSQSTGNQGIAISPKGVYDNLCTVPVNTGSGVTNSYLKEIRLQPTDPGEGVSLDAGKFIGVYDA